MRGNDSQPLRNPAMQFKAVSKRLQMASGEPEHGFKRF